MLNGLDEACDLINILKTECDKEENSCQHVKEYVKVNERAIRGCPFVQILSTLERVCPLEEYPSSEIAIARCKRGDHWSKFDLQFESYSILNIATTRPGTGTLH